VEVPTNAVTPLDGLDAVPAAQLAALGKFLVSFGGACCAARCSRARRWL